MDVLFTLFTICTINQRAFRDNLTPRRNKKQWRIFLRDSEGTRTRDLNSAKSRRNCCDRHEINELPIYWRRKLRNNFKASRAINYHMNHPKTTLKRSVGCSIGPIPSDFDWYILFGNNGRIKKIEGDRFESFDCGWSLAPRGGVKTSRVRRTSFGFW